MKVTLTASIVDERVLHVQEVCTVQSELNIYTEIVTSSSQDDM